MRLSAFLLLSALAGFGQARKVTDEEVMRVHRAAYLIDTHNDITSRTVDGFDIGEKSTTTHTDLQRMKAGGMGGQFFAVFVAANYTDGNHSANRTLQMIDTVKHDIVERYPKDFVFCRTADEVLGAKKQGKMAALMGIEGGHAIEDSLRLLRDFYDLGIRYMTLTHANTNGWADSSGDISDPKVKHHNGLSEFGKNVVREMNRLGMMVDISHVADKTFWDALEVSHAPIIASHSSCRAIANVPRNMTDDMITALGKKGGVVQVNFSCDYVSQRYADANRPIRAKRIALLAELREKYKDDPVTLRLETRKVMATATTGIPRPPLSDLVDHIDHIVKLAGVDAVGIGSDFDGVGCVPEGMEDVSKYPNLTKALLERGYSAEDIRKIYSGNILRVMKAAEKTASELQKKS